MKRILVLAGLALALFYALFKFYIIKNPPALPQDLFHTAVTSNAACTACHTPGKQAPLGESHPPRTDCLSCHKDS